MSAKRPWFIDLTHGRIGSFIKQAPGSTTGTINVHWVPAGFMTKPQIIEKVPEGSLVRIPIDASPYVPSEGLVFLTRGEFGEGPVLGYIDREMYKNLNILQEQLKNAKIQSAGARIELKQSKKDERTLFSEHTNREKLLHGSTRQIPLRRLPPEYRSE